MTTLTYLLDPDVGGHDLVLEVDVDELGELEAEAHRQLLRVVGHGPDQPVVVRQQVVVQPLRVRVAPRQACNMIAMLESEFS